MLDTRDRHGTNQLTRKTSGLPAPSPHVTSTATTHMEGSHPLQQLQLPRHGDNVSGSPELATATEDDYYARGGEKKGRVKQVSRGRKRRLDDQALDTDGDYGPAPTSNHPLPAKRPRTYDETGPVQAADEKQRAGCTDEDLLQQQVERETDHDNEDQVEEEELHHVVDYDVPDPPPRTWVAKAEWALGLLGGRGTLADIYSTIEEAFPEEVDGKRNWKAAIRSCLSKNEKNKFFKPEASATSAKGDHVWCLAASSRRAAPTTKRGRPAGRSKRSSSATTTTASTTGATRTGRSRGRSRSAPLYNEEEAEEEEKKQVEFVVPRAPVKREERNVVVDEARRLETLLQRKQQLEQDISRLQEEVNEDGLSADQEDFLSQLLA